LPTPSIRLRAAALAAFLTALLVTASARAQTHGGGAPSFSLLGSEVSGDFKFVVNSVQLDAEDIVTSPLYITSDNSVLRSPKFYLGFAAVGAAFGASYSLDQTFRSHLRDMGSGTADTLENVSYGSVGAATGLLYLYGLYTDDVRARHIVLTAGEGAGVASLLDLGIKAAFGRLRPRQDHHSHTQFFDGGASFVSGDVTPMFALAAGVSEYFDNRWYVAVPVYSLALADGFGRMGHDAHWFSDVVGAAILGWGTTELLLYLHRQHEMEPSRWRLFATGGPSVPQGSLADADSAGVGVGFAYSW
jgi:membrane-associated phospholipid phosphatase